MKTLVQFILSFSVVLYIVTFVLRIPQTISKSPSLVDEYYLKNFATSVPLDFLLVFIYLQIAMYIIDTFHVYSFIYRNLVVAGTTACLTGGFCFYFLQTPQTSNFFSRWFHKVGYVSIIYDIILLVGTYNILNHLHYIT